MKINAGKWALIIAFQILYGLLIFAVTRDIYMKESPPQSAAVTQQMPPGHPPVTAKQITPGIPGSSNFTVTAAERLIASVDESAATASAKTPQELARLADESFAQKNYQQAASLYERVLKEAPQNVDVYNNLGLTLHYIGRSDEAVRRLEQGVDVDGSHQRIWLTLGFVRAQIGNVDGAKEALQRAVELDPSSTVGMEASRMMTTLP